MVATNLVWLFMIPLLFSVATFFILPKLGTRITHGDALKFALAGFVVSVGLMTVLFYTGKDSLTRDLEILNGQVVGKQRVHDEYTESYQCNCVTTTDSKGQSSTSCQTCYRQHYTVEWLAETTFGNHRLEYVDRESQSVYRLPDPDRYTSTVVGEPYARSHAYTNYIKAVPESLFHPSADSLRLKYAALLPAYPGAIYDEWHVDRVLGVGIKIPDAKAWNADLSKMLSTLGPQKQVNAIVVFVAVDNPDYEYALQAAWLGGKKNDVVLIIGTPKFPERAAWVRVLAMTDTELFKIRLRDEVMALSQLDREAVLPVLQSNIRTLFKRKPMYDYEYLDAHIDPPAWIYWLSVALTSLLYLVSWFLIWRSVRPHYRKY